MKKTLTLLLSAIMLVSAFALPMSAGAAQKNCLTVTVSGTQYNSIIDDTVNLINEKRASYSLSPITVDASLQTAAQKRAAEIMTAKDYDTDVLPDGSSITTRFPGYGTTQKTYFGSLTELTVEKLNNAVGSYLSYSSAKDVKSVGIAAFEFNGSKVYYAVSSTEAAASAYGNYANAPYSLAVSLGYTNIKYTKLNMTPDNNSLYYNLSFGFEGSGYYYDYFTALNTEVSFVSSKPTVFKIKGTKGYVKKEGKVVIYVKDADGNDLYAGEISTTVSKVSPYITELKSKKKKTAFIKWTQNVTNASGYQIQYSTSKKFKKAKTITVKGKKKVSRTIKKLKSKKKYYFRVRAYVDQGDGEKMFTPWSEKKPVKIK